MSKKRMTTRAEEIYFWTFFVRCVFEKIQLENKVLKYNLMRSVSWSNRSYMFSEYHFLIKNSLDYTMWKQKRWEILNFVSSLPNSSLITKINTRSWVENLSFIFVMSGIFSSHFAGIPVQYTFRSTNQLTKSTDNPAALASDAKTFEPG